MQESHAAALEVLLVPLGDVLEEVVLVGGAAIPLWVDVPGAPPARATNDTDVIVAARSRVQYHKLGERLRARGFGEVMESRVICRWRHLVSGALYDVMPLDADILGFSNEWYEDAFSSAREVVLPAGLSVRVASPPYLLATKLVAFGDRGRGDFLASHDIHDVVALVDGRSTLLDEIQSAVNARGWIASEFQAMLESGSARDAIHNYLPFKAAPDAEAILVETFRRVAALGH
jgi:predicted nucleotidyltransferase